MTFWEVDILGIDISGVDILGVDILGRTRRNDDEEAMKTLSSSLAKIIRPFVHSKVNTVAREWCNLSL